MIRLKRAIIISIFLVVAVVLSTTIDYTDTYVADRFHKALRADQYEVGSPFSLDAFLEYYDWDEVCVVVPGMEVPDLKTRFGLAYNHKPDSVTDWSLIFVKSYYVVAEIHIKRQELEHPREMAKEFFERWAAIVEIVDDGKGKRMEFVGD